MKREGFAEATLRSVGERLRLLCKYIDLDDPESVKSFIACRSCWSNSFKNGVAQAYDHYVKVNGLSWSKPRFKVSVRLPYIASREQINRLIAHCKRKYALILSVLRDTGMRPIELHRLTLRSVDLEKGVIRIGSSKGGLPRTARIKNSTLAMLIEYVRKHGFGLDERMFPTSKSMCKSYCRARKNLSKKLQDLSLMKIRLYDFRHYFATMLYHKTKDILYVKQQLGHRRIENTLIYTHLVNFSEEEFTIRTARDVETASKLLEAGFQYVTEMDGARIFRKRK